MRLGQSLEKGSRVKLANSDKSRRAIRVSAICNVVAKALAQVYATRPKSRKRVARRSENTLIPVADELWQPRIYVVRAAARTMTALRAGDQKQRLS